MIYCSLQQKKKERKNLLQFLNFLNVVKPIVTSNSLKLLKHQTIEENFLDSETFFDHLNSSVLCLNISIAARRDLFHFILGYKENHKQVPGHLRAKLSTLIPYPRHD